MPYDNFHPVFPRVGALLQAVGIPGSKLGWRSMVRLALQEPSPRTRPANLWELKTVFCDPQNCIFPQKTVFCNKMRTAMQIKKKTSQHTVRGALQSSVVFTHNIKSIINFKSNKTLVTSWCTYLYCSLIYQNLILLSRIYMHIDIFIWWVHWYFIRFSYFVLWCKPLCSYIVF